MLNSANFWIVAWVSLLVGIPLIGVVIYLVADRVEGRYWPDERNR